MGKGSIQQVIPPALGQHNILERALLGIGGALADSYTALGRLPRSWDDAVQQFLTVMPGGGLLGMAARRVQFTPEMRSIARQQYQAGMSLRDVADRVGVDISTLARHFAEEGVQIRGLNRIDLPLDRLQAMYEQGTLDSVARELGVNATTVRNRLRELGVDTSNPSRAPGILGQVGSMRQEGLSYGEIARQLGLTRNQVAGMVRDLRARGEFVPSILLGVLGALEATQEELIPK